MTTPNAAAGARFTARVEHAVLTCAALHGPMTTVGELRRFFADDHVHMAVLVDAGRLIAAVEPQDLDDDLGDDTGLSGAFQRLRG
jgi:hypothetical protein